MAASVTAETGDVTRIEAAPTAAASAGWSTWKLDSGDVASAARTSSGVRLLAASVMPVIVLVSPQPWCTDTAATDPLMRAYASAIVAAPLSWRAATNPRATLDEGVGDVEVAGADHAEHLADTESGQRPPDGLGHVHCVPRPRRPQLAARSLALARSHDANVHGHLSTKANTRAGLPDPDTMGSGPAMMTAPVGGNWARCCSWVKPYLPLPSRYE